jgi:hypothetical protein
VTKKKPAKKPRKRRVTVGARDAGTGQFVDKEKLETEPQTTVAVTREGVPPADYDRTKDEEC